jgi:hypothetical protein
MRPGVVEEDEDDHSHDDFHGEFPASPPRSHTRHTSIGSWGRPADMERSQGLLRRLSMSSAFGARVSVFPVHYSISIYIDSLCPADGCELFSPADPSAHPGPTGLPRTS